MSKTSILVIDDDAATQQLVASNIEADKADVVVVTDMKEGLAYVKTRLPALIVVNADLPKGWRLCTEFKKHERFAAIPLVIISAQASQEVFYQHQGLPTRADAYLHKPLDGDTLSMTFLGLLDYSLGDPVEADHLADDSGMIEFDLFEDDGVEVDVVLPGPPPLDGASADALKARIAELEDQLRTQRQTEEERLKAQAQVGFARLQDLQKERDEARLQVEELSASLDAARSEAAGAGDSEAQVTALQARVDELLEASKRLEEARASEAQELAELRQTKEALETERDAMADKARSESSEVGKHLEEAQAKAATAVERAADAEKELGEAQGRLEELEQALAAKAEGADAQVQALEEAKATLLQEKADALQGKADALGRLQALEDEKAELTARAEEAEQATKALEEKLAAAAEEAEQAAQALEEKLAAAAEEAEQATKALEEKLAAATAEGASSAEEAQGERDEAVARAAELEAKLAAAEQAAAEATERAEAAEQAQKESQTKAVDAEGERERADRAMEKAQGELQAAKQHEALLQEHLAAVDKAYTDATANAAATDMALREALAQYQMREGGLLTYQGRSQGLLVALKTVGDLIQGALTEHGGDEDFALPPAPDGVPAPVAFEPLPGQPKRQAPPRPTGKVTVSVHAGEHDTERPTMVDMKVAERPEASVVDAVEVLVEMPAPPPPPPPPGSEEERLPDDPDLFAGDDDIADIQPFVPE